MKRSATLALAALALASLCASASAGRLSADITVADPVTGRRSLTTEKCDGYVRVKYSSYDQYAYDPKDWTCTNLKALSCYDCCHAPLPEPKCWKVEDYTEYDSKYDDYTCTKVENKWGYYWDCCAKEPEPPCEKVDSYDPKLSDDHWECTLHEYHYISYYICCPKPLPPPQCYKVESGDYKEYEYTDWVCTEVSNGYESYWDCCAPEVKPPCQKVDYYVPDDYSDLVCELHDYHYISYHVCCPKPLPEPKCWKVDDYDSYDPKYDEYICTEVTNGYETYWDCCAKPVEPPCEKVEYYTPDDYSDVICTPHDYHYTTYYICCPKPDPCIYPEYDSYKPKPEKEGYECVENYGPDGYEIINWKCCPVEDPCKYYDYTNDYDHGKPTKEGYECVEEYGPDGYTPMKWKCCPKDEEPPTAAPTYYEPTKAPSRSQDYPAPTPKVTPAPTPKKTAKPQPPVCKADKKKKCCVVDRKGKKEYKAKGYKCEDIRRSRGKYLCCKALPRPPKPVCFHKKIGRRTRKCCYDPTKKIKKNRQYRCFSASYGGKKGDYCYKA